MKTKIIKGISSSWSLLGHPGGLLRRPSADKWFSLSLGGQKIGYLHESSAPRRTGAGTSRETRIEMKMTFNRLGNKVEMATISTTREDDSGRILSFETEVKPSSQAMRTEGLVAGREIRLTRWSGDTSYTRNIPFEGDFWVLGESAPLPYHGWPARGCHIYQTFSPELSQVVKGERRVLGREPVEGLGGQAALKIEESLAGIPMKRTIWLNGSGEEIRTSDPTPFGDVLGVLSDKTEALRGADSGNLPEERYQQSLALSNVRLPRARDIDSVTIRIRHLKPELGWPDFPGPYQTALSKTAEELVLRIDRPALPRKGPAQASGPEDLEANAYLDTTDPMIRKTAEKIAGKIHDPFDKAIALRNWVGANMTFDLGIVSPPAREVIRNRRGTCVGYAMLLTTLARSAGIPARFLMGYVYLNGIWGGHAWTEVFIHGSWVPLDAAVIGPGIADAARFHFSRSNLASGIGEASLGGIQVYGAINVEIAEFRLAGRTIRVPAGQKLYEVSGDAYLNPGLGLGVSKPEGFTFADLDKTWPDNTLLRMTGPGGASVRILQETAGPDQEPRTLAYRLIEEAGIKGMREDGRILGRPAYRVTAEGKSGADLFRWARPFDRGRRRARSRGTARKRPVYFVDEGLARSGLNLERPLKGTATR